MSLTNNLASTTVNATPRKVRLVATLVRGMSVKQALTTLAFVQKKSSVSIAKLIKSACSNAGLSPAAYDQHRIGTITVDEFTKLKRTMPRGRGSAAKFTRRWSKIKVEIE